MRSCESFKDSLHIYGKIRPVTCYERREQEQTTVGETVGHKSDDSF